ncbi:unnamed protein product, partial [Iphiclides podalirius]
MNWSSCSPDIIFLIFKKLDNKSLLTCLAICQLWRDVAYYIIETKDNMWQSLAEDTLYNKAICFKQKSTLSWQEICFNSLLWINLNTIKVKLDKTWVLKRENIKAIHMYKDQIIIIYDSIAEYFNVKTSSRVVKKPSLIDSQETEHITISLMTGNELSISFKHNSTRYSPLCYVFKLIDDRCFVIDSKNNLWRYKCCGRGYGVRFIMRTYDSPGSILTLNVFDKDVYILTNNGIILNVLEWGLHYCSVGKVEQPNFYNSPVIVMFLKHSIVYSVPCQSETDTMSVSKIGDTEEVLIECPGMTCATPHGELLLLGYEDGTVEICYPQKLLSNTSSNLKFNIKDLVGNTLEKVAIVALDVYEAEGAQYLFVATQCDVYKVILHHEKVFFSKRCII